MVDETDKWENRIKRMRKDKYCIELTEEYIKKNRDEIICLLRSIGREGIDTVIEHLDANNYFTYAASKARHDSFYGGLAIIR